MLPADLVMARQVIAERTRLTETKPSNPGVHSARTTTVSDSRPTCNYADRMRLLGLHLLYR